MFAPATLRGIASPPRWAAMTAALVALAAAIPAPHAATSLADQPLFASNEAPGNLALALSVEFPTAVSVAHTNRTYSSAAEYLGFFDPNKCYAYRYTDGASTDNYFYPTAVVANHNCSSQTSGRWSGNFLNWATMQTIDPFRWVLTGGYRVIDTSTLTVIEKAWASGQGGTGNFPDSTLPSTDIAGATPYASTAGTLYMRVQGLGNKIRFATNSNDGFSFRGRYYNNVDRSGTPVLDRTDAAIDFDWGNGSPGSGVNTDNISARWDATVTVPTTGNYQFRFKADDVAELFINGTSVINQTSYQSMNYQTSGNISLTAGNTFTVRLNFRENTGGAAAQLQWKKPGDADFVTMGTSAASLYSGVTHYNAANALTNGITYEAFVRAKACDSTVGRETNCVQYGSNWKPEGLIQKYSDKIRYSAFAYLNDDNILRDGGVLRARQKFVGPTQPVPGASPASNAAREWDGTTGVFIQNPDTADVATTNALFGTAIADSGVMNYLNKFGMSAQSYKTYDNVGELYYAAIRYFRNQGNVPAWTDATGAVQTDKTKWVDGFPVINTWTDPILYSCQRNFILGIGDVNTHADKNVPGNSSTANEPTLPNEVANDSTWDAVTSTNRVGTLEGIANLGTTFNYNGCCSNNSARMAGLAYQAHTQDIRPTDFLTDAWRDVSKKPITIDTYWVDVQEYQQYVNNNQFYLATKYGGFKVPTGYTFGTALTESWWHSNTDVLGSNKRPDNYYAGNRPDLVQAGLNAAFADIAAKIKSFTTSFSTSLPQVAVSGNASFSSQFDASNWSGEIKASELSFNSSGDPSLTEKWTFTSLLATQLAGTGWDTNRRIATWDPALGTTGAGVAFRGSGTSKISTAQKLLLNPSYVTGDDSTNYLNYLRGDQSNETASTATGSTKAYRTRAKLIGDIVGSKARPIGPPAFPFSDATNPGYSGFKTTNANRPTVVYVGSNDGMLHAINGALTGTDAGKEMFAYIPAALFQGPNNTPNVDGLASLGNPSFTHHYMVNATPNVYDVDFGRTPNATGQPQTNTADWRSILIGGMGKGGKSYYAIDVTDPTTMSASETSVAAKVLWEFQDSDLGYTYGDPAVVKTRKYGWVVIFPSGYNNSDNQGHILIVNPRTGALLEKVSTGVGDAAGPAGLAHLNAFVVDASDGTADAVYAGDLLGNLWRMDLTAPVGTAYTAPLKIASLTAPNGSAQPITSRPAIEVHPSTKKRFVMVGTGRLLDTTDIASTQIQSFYAITDGINARFNTSSDLPTGISFAIDRSKLLPNTDTLALDAGQTTDISFDPNTKMGWYEDLGTGAGGIGWRITTDASTLSGSIAFAATLPNGSVCNPSGDSRIYGRDYATANTTVRDNTTSAPASYVNIAGTVTDLRYLSVSGKATLISGTDTGNVSKININPIPSLTLRRLNWRELQVVE